MARGNGICLRGICLRGICLYGCFSIYSFLGCLKLGLGCVCRGGFGYLGGGFGGRSLAWCCAVVGLAGSGRLALWSWLGVGFVGIVGVCFSIQYLF